MANYKSEAFIGKTKYAAGIFLSENIAKRKKYSRHLKLEKFSDFTTAKVEFFRRYQNISDDDNFKLNRLYAIRFHLGFDVFWSKFTVLVGQGFDYGDVFDNFFREDGEDMFHRNFDDYDDAQAFARGRFVSYWGDPELYIRHNLRVGVPVDIDDEFYDD